MVSYRGVLFQTCKVGDSFTIAFRFRDYWILLYETCLLLITQSNLIPLSAITNQFFLSLISKNTEFVFNFLDSI